MDKGLPDCWEAGPRLRVCLAGRWSTLKIDWIIKSLKMSQRGTAINLLISSMWCQQEFNKAPKGSRADDFPFVEYLALIRSPAHFQWFYSRSVASVTMLKSAFLFTRDGGKAEKEPLVSSIHREAISILSWASIPEESHNAATLTFPHGRTLQMCSFSISVQKLQHWDWTG